MAQVARNYLKVYVGNLPWTIGNNELKQYFSKFGHLTSASVVFDKNTGISRNYGFVIYSSKEGFESATNVQSHKLEGNNLKVQPAGTEKNQQ